MEETDENNNEVRNEPHNFNSKYDTATGDASERFVENLLENSDKKGSGSHQDEGLPLHLDYSSLEEFSTDDEAENGTAPGDVGIEASVTHALEPDSLKADLGEVPHLPAIPRKVYFRPKTPLKEGMETLHEVVGPLENHSHQPISPTEAKDGRNWSTPSTSTSSETKLGPSNSPSTPQLAPENAVKLTRPQSKKKCCKSRRKLGGAIFPRNRVKVMKQIAMFEQLHERFSPSAKSSQISQGQSQT